MAKELRDGYSQQFDMTFIFANTGCELEQTLGFVHKMTTCWAIPIVWVEAVVHHGEEKGTTHRVVTFETASRKGQPFEEVIKKYGIPNKGYPHCTRELKLAPVHSYMRTIADDYLTAIGIRADEPDRLSRNPKLIYPLATMFPSNKAMVNDWWEDQPFQLGLLSHQGNCSWCWKKSLNKHIRLIKEAPQIFEFPARMEATYPHAGASADGKPRTFFRGYRSTNDLIQIAALMPERMPLFPDMDEDAGCTESCEVTA